MFRTRILSRESFAILPKRFGFLTASKYGRELSTKRPVDGQEEETVDHLKANPYFDKYAEKINLMRETSPAEMENRLVAIMGKKKSKELASTPIQTKSKRLEDIVQIKSFHGKSAAEVEMLWSVLQQEEHRFMISLSSENYKKIEERGNLYPTFLFPLPRITGFEFIVSQFSGHEVHFSPLINYQTFKENAPECLAVTHFTEVENTTNLVLVLGEFNTDVLDRTEAVCLYHQLQRYYGEDDPRRLRLVQQFTNSPESFQHMDLIAELEALKQPPTIRNT